MIIIRIIGIRNGKTCYDYHVSYDYVRMLIYLRWINNETFRT